jgi:hypothetical protein
MAWWWLSFAGEDGSRGVAVVQGRDMATATQAAWDLGCNPGGEVLGLELSDDLFPTEDNRNRLLPPAEARELVAALHRLTSQKGT